MSYTSEKMSAINDSNTPQPLQQPLLFYVVKSFEELIMEQNSILNEIELKLNNIIDKKSCITGECSNEIRKEPISFAEKIIFEKSNLDKNNSRLSEILKHFSEII